MRDFGAAAGAGGRLRTERDMPIMVVLVGSLLLALFLAVTPGMPMQWNFVAAILIVVFGFFFVTVSSRITGLIGNSSNPISGMTIATLIMTCTHLRRRRLARRRVCADRARRRRGGLHRRVDRRSDLAGSEDRLSRRRDADPAADRAHHRRAGRVVRDRHDDALSAPIMVIGSPSLPAPQATLMATIIKGLLSQNLPWGLVLVGVFISVTLELCGIRSLSFAVGSYLPIATTAPIFVGGIVRWFVERKTGVAQESEISPGTLFSSGLIAGGSLAGILYAALFGRKIISAADDADTAGTDPVSAQGPGGYAGRWLAVPRARRRAVARGPENHCVRASSSRSRCSCCAAAGGRARRPTVSPRPQTHSIANPLFFHGKRVVLRHPVRQTGRADRTRCDEQAGLHLLARATVRDRGRDPRRVLGPRPHAGRRRAVHAPTISRPVVEAANKGRWPARDQVFVILGATFIPGPAATVPDDSIDRPAAGAIRQSRRSRSPDGSRGDNLFGDLPAGGREEQVGLRAAVGRRRDLDHRLRPKGKDFDLDPRCPGRHRRWLEVTGTVHASGGTLDCRRIDPPDDRADRRAGRSGAGHASSIEPPPTVIFSAPLADETDFPSRGPRSGSSSRAT